jgi:hypothetical protein
LNYETEADKLIEMIRQAKQRNTKPEFSFEGLEEILEDQKKEHRKTSQLLLILNPSSAEYAQASQSLNMMENLVTAQSAKMEKTLAAINKAYDSKLSRKRPR